MSYSKKISIAVLVAIFTTGVPNAVYAHIVNIENANLAAVAADGHNHEHAPVAPVPVKADDGHDHVHAGAPATGLKDFVGDGHTDHSHAVGGSTILMPWSSQWWSLLLVSLLLTSVLSWLVWKYIDGATPKKVAVKEPAKVENK